MDGTFSGKNDVSRVSKWTASSRYLRIARPDQDGRYAIATLAPGEYFAIAVDLLDDNDRGNPDYLEALSARATTLTLREGERKVLNLKP